MARRTPAVWIVATLTALAYAGSAALALMLAGPPGFASPLYPPAGIALAAALAAGPAALPGVFLGALAVNLGLAELWGAAGPQRWWLPTVVATGAMLQAQFGVWLLRRFVGAAPEMAEPGEVIRFGLLGGPLACLTSASVGTAALWLTGVLEADKLSANWGTWWLGDTLGVLLAAPLLLTFIGRPRENWRPRRRTLALPLLLALAVLALGVQQVRRLDAARQSDSFEHDSEQLSVVIQQRLARASHALQALHSAARVAGRPLDEAGLRAASRWWIADGDSLQATGVSLRVPLDRQDGFIAETRRQGVADFRVFDRDDGSDRRQRGELLVIRHLEPLERNRGALGVNALSVTAARPAIESARDSGEARASAVFRLTQSSREEPGIVLYQALYEPGDAEPTEPAQRRARWTGTVFVTLRTEAALAQLDLPRAAPLHWCLLDADSGASMRRLASSGPASLCTDRAAQPAELLKEQTFQWGGRLWLLRTVSPTEPLSLVSGEAGLLSLTGLIAAALLGAMLLVITGHSRRTELAVAQGTEQLRQEVAERRHAEAVQHETRERLQRILDNAPIGVLFLDSAGQVIECNARFCEMVRLDAQAIARRPLLDLVHGEDHPHMAALRKDLLDGNASRGVTTVRLGVAQQPWLTVRVIASALRDGDGRVLRIVAVVEDVADQLRLQASEQARLRAEAASRAKNEFLSRMSHELRTPLNAMIGFAQLLGLDREPALPTHQQEWVQQIQRAGWHLLELINETLDLSRIESGAMELNPQALDLRQVAEAAIAMVAGAAAKRDITIEFQVSSDTPRAWADATRVRQVFTNLLSNAVKYNRSGGEVRVTLGSGGAGEVQVTVSDNGLGMDAEQQARLFQPYDRLGREGSGVEGTGIGLVITKRLLEVMDGSLEVDSRPGGGTRFSFTLPTTTAAQMAGAEPAAESQPAPYSQRLVHYVEDNATNVEVMRGVLAQRSQVRLEVSTLGLDALAAIRREPPDLILLDMQLPDIPGPELLRHLKNDDELARIPVIVVSADATAEHVRVALTLGAAHYVTKPLDMASFLACVDEALAGTETRL